MPASALRSMVFLLLAAALAAVALISPDWLPDGLGPVLWLAALPFAFLGGHHFGRRADSEVPVPSRRLPGLADRRQAELELERAFAASIRGEALSVVLVDLDHFDRLRDELGRTVAGEVVRSVSRTVARSTRKMDVVALVDEATFLVVLPASRLAAARRLAERIREAVRFQELESGRVTVSVGVAGYEAGMGSPEVLMAAADRALYRAKTLGRDRVVAAEPDPLTLPGPPEDGGDAPERPPRVRSGATSVLVVDDDARVVRLVCRLLRSRDLQAHGVTGGPEALAWFDEHGPAVDILLTDVLMPEVNGFVLVDEIQARGFELPVIYMSGAPKEDIAWPGAPGDVADFLPKPIELKALMSAIRRAERAVPA